MDIERPPPRYSAIQQQQNPLLLHALRDGQQQRPPWPPSREMQRSRCCGLNKISSRSIQLLTLVLVIAVLVIVLISHFSSPTKPSSEPTSTPPFPGNTKPRNESHVPSPATQKPYPVVPVVSSKYIFSTDELSWFDARVRCEAYGMQLVSIESLSEQIRILGYFSEIGVTPANNSWWTSGTSMYTTADPPRFIWASTWEPVTLSFWHDTEPDNSGIQNCLEITAFTGRFGLRTDGETGWNSWYCDREARFICEDNDGEAGDGFAQI